MNWCDFNAELKNIPPSRLVLFVYKQLGARGFNATLREYERDNKSFRGCASTIADWQKFGANVYYRCAHCAANLGLRADQLNFELTQHAGDEMYHPAHDGFSPVWTPDER